MYPAAPTFSRSPEFRPVLTQGGRRRMAEGATSRINKNYIINNLNKRFCD